MKKQLCIKDLNIVMGGVVLKKWNANEEDYDIIYQCADVYFDNTMYAKYGEMQVYQIYSCCVDGISYIVLLLA